MKKTAKDPLAAAGFTLHKIHSNVPELEDNRQPRTCDDTITFAKQHLGTKSSETKILGIPWDKGRDELSINMTSLKKENEITKRGTLRAMASIFDPLGIASPILLNAKLIYREICDNKLGWDKEVPQDIATKWINWVKLLPTYVSIPRSVITPSQFIYQIELHGFEDASNLSCDKTL